MGKTRILIADDHQIVRDGLKMMLEDQPEIEVVGEAGDGNEVIKLLEEVEVDVVIMDISMPNCSGIEATKRIRTAFPDVKVLMLTMSDSSSIIKEALNAGAMGYILKNTGRTEFIVAIESARDGKNYYSEEVMQTMMNSYSSQKTIKNQEEVHLTQRETDVLKLIAQEYSTTEIASALHISPHTVESHRKNLHTKLGAKNIAGLVRYAISKRLVD